MAKWKQKIKSLLLCLPLGNIILFESSPDLRVIPILFFYG